MYIYTHIYTVHTHIYIFLLFIDICFSLFTNLCLYLFSCPLLRPNYNMSIKSFVAQTNRPFDIKCDSLKQEVDKFINFLFIYVRAS